MNDSAEQVVTGLSTAKKLCFAAILVAIALLLLEGSARLWLLLFPQKIDLAAVSGARETQWFEFLSDDLVTLDEDLDFYQPDSKLFWKLRPNSSLDVPNVVYRMHAKPITWHIEINQDGYRGARYPIGQTAPVIVAMGDSSTFGFRVDDEDTYPVQLQRALRRKGLPGATVVNYGIPGYSSFQGKRLLEEVLAQHKPDVVILSFGANDRESDKLSDADKAERVSAANLELMHYFNQLGVVRIFRSPPEFRRSLQMDRSKQPDRVSRAEFRANMKAMIDLAGRSGARVILLDLVFVEPIFAETVKNLARENALPRIESRTLLRDALVELQEGRRYQAEREVLDRLWKDEIESFRPIYYPASFYAELFADPVWTGLLNFFLVEPVHPNALGHQVIAEALGELIVEAVSTAP